jgi:hypothetical protein
MKGFLIEAGRAKTKGAIMGDIETIIAGFTAVLMTIGLILKKMGVTVAMSNKTKVSTTCICPIKLSEKTGGVYHVSEEGLSKLNRLSDKLEKEYTPTVRQELMCKNAILSLQADMQVMQGEIVKAINGGQKIDVKQLAEELGKVLRG